MADGQAQIVLSAVDRTKAAFDSAKRGLLGVQSAATGVLGAIRPITGAVGLLGGGLAALSFKNIVDGLDALNDLKDATGASIENLSALEDVADRTGTSFDTIGTSLTKLNRDLAQATPGSQTAENLKAIGLNAERLKQLDPAEALLQVARALDGFADSGSKARIIQALFGKSVQEVGPFLKDLAEQGKLNAKVTTEQAEQAEKFNKQLFESQANIKAAARSIVGELLPALSRSIESLKEGRKQYGSFIAALVDQGLRVNPFASLAENIASTNDKLEELQRTRTRVSTGEGLLQSDDEQKQRLASIDREISRLTARREVLKATQRDEILAAQGDNRDARDRRAEESGKLKAPEPPDVEGARKAAAEALANLRRVTDGNVKAIAAGLQEAQDELRFGEQASRQLYSLGLQSLEKYFDDQERARAENLERVRAASAAEIAERQKQLNSPLLRGADKQSERQEVRNQIADAQRKLRDAEREADQQAVLGARERTAALQELRSQVEALDAQIRDLATGGTDLLTERQRIADQVRQAQQLLQQGGASPADAQARAAQFGALLEAQRQFNIARQQFGEITANAAREEERLLLAAERNGAGLLETEDAVRAAREKALGQLEQLIAKTRELAAVNPGNTPLQQYLADLELQAERARAALDPRKLRFDAAADSAAGALTDGLRTAVLEGGKLRDVIADIDKRLSGILLDELVFKPFQQGLANILKGAGGQGLGQNVLSAISGLGFGAPTGAEVARATTGYAGGTLADAASGAAQAAGAATSAATSAASISAAITAASATETAAISSAIATASASEATAITTALATASTAISTAIGSSTASIVSAISASSAGAAAGAASGAGGDALGSFIASLGFDKGGYTGNAGVGQPAGVVHGQEFVFSAPAVKRLGIKSLETLHSFGRGGAARMGREPGSYQIGGFVPSPRRTAAAAPAEQPRGRPSRDLQRPTAILQYTAAPGDSRQTGLQRARDMARELQRGFRGA